jgi:hypothetical protein
MEIDSDGGRGTNAMRERFMAFMNPDIRSYYEEAAHQVGIELGTDTRLTPLIKSVSTTISDATATHPGIPISFNNDTRSQQVRFYFQDAAFIRRVTATIAVPVLSANAVAGFAGPPPVPPFEPQFLTNTMFDDIHPADFVYAQMQRDGSGQLFQDEYVPLSEMTGDGAHSYFFNLIPLVKSGGSILIDITIMPPNNSNFAYPPFVDRIGMVTISMHTERFNMFGV